MVSEQSVTVGLEMNKENKEIWTESDSKRQISEFGLGDLR